MKTWIKRILTSVVVLFLVSILGLAIFLLTLNPNTYKLKLRSLVQAQYHRTLDIGGEIKISLFPRMGLTLEQVSLSEKHTSELFASVEKAQIAVAIWPLLSNKLVIDHIKIEGFKANVVRHKNGEFNFYSLIDTAPPIQRSLTHHKNSSVVAEIKDEVFALETELIESRRNAMQIDITGLDLKNGGLTFQDELTKNSININELEVHTSRITFDQPFNMTFSAQIKAKQANINTALKGQALINLDLKNLYYAAQKLNLHLNGQFAGVQAKNLVLQGDVAFNALTSQFDMTDGVLLFEGDVDKSLIAMKDMSVNFKLPKLEIAALKNQFKVKDLSLSTKASLPTTLVEASLTAPAICLALSARPTSLARSQPCLDTDTKEVIGHLKTPGFSNGETRFGIMGISGHISQINASQGWLKTRFNHDGKMLDIDLKSSLSLDRLKSFIGLSNLTGTLQIDGKNLPQGPLTIPFSGDLTSYLATAQTQAKIKAEIQDSTYHLSSIINTHPNPFGVDFDLNVDTFNLDNWIDLTNALPIKTSLESWLKERAKNTIKGTLKAEQFIAYGIKTTELNSSIKQEDGKLTIGPLTASLYKGQIKGIFTQKNLQDNNARFKLRWTNVEIEPLWKGLGQPVAMSGQSNGTVEANWQGTSWATVRDTFSGSLQLGLRKGVLKGLDIVECFAHSAIGLKGKTNAPSLFSFIHNKPDAQTPFTALTLNLEFVEGLGKVKRLTLTTPYLRVDQVAPSSINLKEQVLNLKALARLTFPIHTRKFENLKRLKNRLITVFITGPFKQLIYMVQ